MSDLDPLRSALLPLAPHQRSALLAASYSYLQVRGRRVLCVLVVAVACSRSFC